jgi:GH15 family glucan-1,4-alpha-glucosidase
VLDGEHVDASLLQLPLVGFIAGHDPRMVSTIDVIREQLDIEGFVMRYRNEDGLQGEEGAFLACSFWLAAALASAGRVQEAEETFEHTMRAANELGLLPEEHDPVSGTALGNFPQGLSHIALITAALAISGAERGEIPHGRAWPLAK